jgi:hypothetical protein
MMTKNEVTIESAQSGVNKEHPRWRRLLATMIASEAGQSVFTRQRRRCGETGRC